MQILRNVIQTYITSDFNVTKVVFEVEVKGKKKEISVKTPKKGKNLLLGEKDLSDYADYLCKDVLLEEDENSKEAVLNLGFIYPQVGDLNCDMCEATGVVTEGEHDDIREVPCPCTLGDEPDFSGATEGDR